MSQTSSSPRCRSPLLIRLVQIVLVALSVFYAFRCALDEEARRHPDSNQVGPPREALRVFHPGKVSLIRPPNWEVRLLGDSLDNDPGGLALSTPAGAMPHAELFLVRLEEEPRLDGVVQEIPFQGQPAKRSLVHNLSRRKEHAGNLKAEICFRRNNWWWYFRYVVIEDRDDMPDYVIEYLNTVKILN